MAEKTTQTIHIEADPGTVLEVIADIDSYPEWISEYKEAEVQERGADGYPKVVRFVMDAGVIKDTMVMSYTVAERPPIAELDPGLELAAAFARRLISLGAQGIWHRCHL